MCACTSRARVASCRNTMATEKQLLDVGYAYIATVLKGCREGVTDEVRRSLEALLDPDVRYRVGFVSPPKAGLNEFLAFLQMDKQVYSGWSMEVLAAAAVAPPAAAGAGNSSSGAAGGGPLPAAAPQQQPSNTVLGGASGVAALATVACGGGTTDYHSTVVPPLPSSPTAALHVHARPAALGVVCEQPRSAASSTAAGQPQRHGVVYLWTLESATNTSSFRGQPPTNKTGHSYTLHRLVVSASSGRITQAWARYQLFDEIKASLLTDPSAAQPPDWDGRPFMHRLLLAQQRRRQAAAGADDSAAPLLQPPEGGPLLLPREYAAAPAPAGAAAAETSVLAPPLAVVHDFAVHAAKGLGAWAQLVDSSFAGLRDTYSGLTDDMHVWDAYGLWGATTTAEAGGRGGGGPGLLANASSRDEVVAMLEALHERYDVHVTCHEVALAAVAASAGADLAAGSGGGGSTTSSSPMPPVAFGFWTATVRNRSKSSSSGSAAIQPQQSDPAAAGQPLFELSSLEVYGFDAWGRLSDVLMYRTPLDAEMAALVKAPGA